MLQHPSNVLSTGSCKHTQLLSYDATFNFGEFYISVPLFCSVCFYEKPVIPALIMLLLHEHALEVCRRS